MPNLAECLKRTDQLTALGIEIHSAVAKSVNSNLETGHPIGFVLQTHCSSSVSFILRLF